MTLEADPTERLVAPPEPLAAAPLLRFVMLLAFSLVFHATALALLLSEDSAQAAMQEQEISVEVIIEPPREKKVEPPQPREKPPKEKVTIDEKPAFDAPRAANKETIERDAPDKETKAARMAPPTEQIAPKPAPVKKPSAAQVGAIQPPPQSAPQKLADAKPDAETLDKAEPAPQTKPEEKQALAEAEAPPAPAKKQTIADQIAALAPLPDYQLGAAAKPAPVAGGTARTTYLSILFGLIMRQMHVPPGARTKSITGQVIISFYIDEMGNLTHQAVFRSSGQQDLDAAALAAVRRAAPFPAPPRGYPHAIQFHYSNR
ncbi:MAG: TonB family protein [Methylocystis sp.]|nr:TonB family protein [Methylocystis sp.]